MIKENNKLVQDFRRGLEIMKKVTEELLESYIDECSDDFGAISIYLYAAFRDYFDFGDLKERLYKIFCLECSENKIDKNVILRRMHYLSGKEKDNPNFYNIIDLEIKRIISELKEKYKK